MTSEYEDYDPDTPTEADLCLFYGGKYLSGTDVGERKIKTKIKRVRKEEFRNSDGTKQTKFVLYLENATNVQTLIDALGRVPGNWIGAIIIIFVDRNVTFAGKRVAGLRLRVVVAAPTKPASSLDEPGLTDMDDDIPFERD
jgi:hypothetical protein